MRILMLSVVVATSARPPLMIMNLQGIGQQWEDHDCEEDHERGCEQRESDAGLHNQDH